MAIKQKHAVIGIIILCLAILSISYFSFRTAPNPKVTGMAVSDTPQQATTSSDTSYPAVKFASADYNSATGLVYQGLGADNKEHIYKDKAELSIQGKQKGSVNVIDYKNNGQDSVFTTGFYLDTKGNEVADTGLYDNFQNKVGSFPNVKYSSSCWADFDNNGFVEPVLIGEDDNQKKYFNVYKNDNGAISLDYSLGGISKGAVKCFDYNNDGWTDVVACGLDGSGKPVSYLFENNHGKLQQKQEFTGLYYCDININTFSGTNKLDIVISGQDSNRNRKTFLYTNQGDTFSESQILADISIDNPKLSSADFHNNGFADLIISGSDTSTGTSKTLFYKNNNGNFEQETLAILQLKDTAILSYNSNNQLNIFITGSEKLGVGSETIKSQLLTDVPSIIGASTSQNIASSSGQTSLEPAAANPYFLNLPKSDALSS